MVQPKPVSLSQVDAEDYDGPFEPQPLVVVGPLPASPGGVSSVNGEDGDVVLNAASVGATTPAEVSEAIEAAIAQTSGWGSYGDTQYTSVSPFTLSGNTDTIVPNNAGVALETQLPSDATHFYDVTTGKVLGNEGNSGVFTVDLMARPQTNAATQVEMWWDIGGAVGKFFEQVVTFPKGQGVTRPIVYTGGVYIGSTWAANGARFYMRSDGPLDIWGVRYMLQRVHKAR